MGGCSWLISFFIFFATVNLLCTIASIVPFFWAWNKIFQIKGTAPFQPSVVTFIYQRCQKKVEVSDSCPICLAEYANGDMISHGKFCFHTFHTECLRRWIRKHPLCPCCRRNVFQLNNSTK